MKLLPQEQSFFGDFSIIKPINLAPISSISRLLIVLLLIFSSTISLSFGICEAEKNTRQVPVKKVPTNPVKRTVPIIVKGKVKKKNKKSVVIKQDTLKDTDPTAASSPLYNN